MNSPTRSEKSDLAGASDEELVNVAVESSKGLGEGATVEIMRRLRLSLLEFSRASEKWSRVLAALTVVLIVLTAVLVYLAWALLARG